MARAGPTGASVPTETGAVGGGPEGTGDPARRRRGRRVVPIVVILALVATLAWWSNDQADGYYVYQPGSAPQITTSAECRPSGSGDYQLPGGKPCARLVLPAGRTHTTDGTLLMVDVLVGKATATQYLLHRLGLLDHFSHGSQLIPDAQVLGTTPASQLACQDAEEMTGATTTAPVVALQRLGYKVGVDNRGAEVVEVVPGTAAAQAGVRCNDIITAIAGRPVRTITDVTSALKGRPPGSSVDITVLRTGARTAKLTLHAVLRARPAIDGLPAAPKMGFLGIDTVTDTTYTLPFEVKVEVGDIGGPSAGLALTLGLLDVLSNGRLTGGHAVAATGTIAPDGQVGDVGGVAQKTVAVERAGAQLFLVPPEEYAAAESEANGKMKIEKVTSVTQALAELKAFGGQIPSTAG
jgi:PDZ domain-containing protein